MSGGTSARRGSALERSRQRRARREETVAAGQSWRPWVLLVDDEVLNMEAVARTLGGRFEINTFDNPEEAFELVRRGECPDLIITDQRMPQMTGAELLSAAVQVHPQCVGLIISGYSERQDLVGAINQAHVFAYLTKPWHPETLLETIDRALVHSDQRREQFEMAADLEILGKKMSDLTDRMQGSVDGSPALFDEIQEQLPSLSKSLDVIDDPGESP